MNGLNQYTSVKGASPAYDPNGNMTANVPGRGFAYDAENVLRHVEDSAGALVADYDYYADGTRSFKSAMIGGPLTGSRFFYDGDQEVLETDNASGSFVGRVRRIRASLIEVERE